VLALDSALFGAEGWTPAGMATEFAGLGDTRTLIVAYAGDELLGYGILLAVAEIADLQRIGVASKAQRRGLGSRLLQVLVDRATGSGCDRMLLEVDAHNVAATALYRRLEFVEISRSPDYYREGADAIVMARDLRRRTDE